MTRIDAQPMSPSEWVVFVETYNSVFPQSPLDAETAERWWQQAGRRWSYAITIRALLDLETSWMDTRRGPRLSHLIAARQAAWKDYLAEQGTPPEPEPARSREEQAAINQRWSRVLSTLTDDELGGPMREAVRAHIGGPTDRFLGRISEDGTSESWGPGEGEAILGILERLIPDGWEPAERPAAAAGRAPRRRALSRGPDAAAGQADADPRPVADSVPDVLSEWGL